MIWIPRTVCLLGLAYGACATGRPGAVDPEFAPGKEASLPAYQGARISPSRHSGAPLPPPTANLSPPSAPPVELPVEQAVADSAFEGDVDGWTVSGDAQGKGVTPDYNGTGGNPGGLISAKDDVAGGTFYFVAPAKYYGDRSASYAKRISFDLKTTKISKPFVAYGVMLSGGGTTIIAMLPFDPTPAETWRSYAYALDPSGGWRVVSSTGINPEVNFANAQVASEQDIRKVLGALTLWRIRGEFNSGSERGSLDNVRFGF
jgi:hypothetical protein